MQHVAAVVGTFDGVHRGHRFLLGVLSRLSRESNLTPRVYTFEKHPLEIIAPDRAPLMIDSASEKLSLLREMVEDIELLDFSKVRNLTAREFMEMLVSDGVELLLVGHDNRFGSDGLRTVEEFIEAARGLNLRIVAAPALTDKDGREINSTQVRQALERGDVELAASLLERPYSLTGTVVKGKQLGRTIGFPTANLCPKGTARKLVPANGVYACEVNIGDHSFPAMVNIGVRPSVDGEGASRSIEANIIGFGGNLYGTELSLKFIKRLRDENKFDSLDALKSQLEKDRVATEAVMNAFCK